MTPRERYEMEVEASRQLAERHHEEALEQGRIEWEQAGERSARQAVALERIADALERVATALDKSVP